MADPAAVNNDSTPADVTPPGTEPTNTPAGGDVAPPNPDPNATPPAPTNDDPPPNPLFGVPEGDYESPQMPEGVELDEGGMKAFSELAKEYNLSQEGLNKIVDFEANRLKALMDSSAKAWADQVEEMEKKCREDPDIGGARYDEATATINAGVKKYAGSDQVSQEALAYLNTTGALSNPAVRKLLHNVGLSAREDNVGGSNTNKGRSTPQLSAAEKIFTKSLKE